jgi:nucleoside phosphorylase
MSRYTDVYRLPDTGTPPPLPIVDWKRVKHSAPVPITGVYDGPEAPLPKCDVVVLTWTSAEWSALDHVFVNSQSTRKQSDREWEHAWHTYSRNAGGASTDNPGAPLWGLYRLVDIATTTAKTQRVMVFKCDAHLAHPPWLDGLARMVGQILDETGASWIWSIGTAGGSRLDIRLGDVVITNAAHIQLQKPDNKASKINNDTFKGKVFPASKLFSTVQEHLFFEMTTVVTHPVLERMLSELHIKDASAASLTLDSLVNEPLSPANLRQSRVLPMDDTPLLTTDYYYIASGTDAEKWAVLEMDDAVIAWVAEQKGRHYAFARNISDPLVPSTAHGKPIDESIRGDWSGLVYNNFGFYTSFNGALATWAAITAM